MVRVAVVMGVIGGVGVTCGLFVGAIHFSFLPFDTVIIANNYYKIKYKIVTILLNRRAGWVRVGQILSHPQPLP